MQSGVLDGGKNVEIFVNRKNITSFEKVISVFEPVRILPENLTDRRLQESDQHFGRSAALIG